MDSGKRLKLNEKEYKNVYIAQPIEDHPYANEIWAMIASYLNCSDRVNVLLTSRHNDFREQVKRIHKKIIKRTFYRIFTAAVTMVSPNGELCIGGKTLSEYLYGDHNKKQIEYIQKNPAYISALTKLYPKMGKTPTYEQAILFSDILIICIKNIFDVWINRNEDRNEDANKNSIIIEIDPLRRSQNKWKFGKPNIGTIFIFYKSMHICVVMMIYRNHLSPQPTFGQREIHHYLVNICKRIGIHCSCLYDCFYPEYPYDKSQAHLKDVWQNHATNESIQKYYLCKSCRTAPWF